MQHCQHVQSKCESSLQSDLSTEATPLHYLPTTFITHVCCTSVAETARWTTAKTWQAGISDGRTMVGDLLVSVFLLILSQLLSMQQVSINTGHTFLRPSGVSRKSSPLSSGREHGWQRSTGQCTGNVQAVRLPAVLSISLIDTCLMLMMW